MPARAEDTVSKVQRYLNILGYDAGVVDGLYGKKTEHALEVFYSERDQIDNNELNPACSYSFNNRRPECVI